MLKLKPLTWSEVSPPNKDSYYHHTTCKTAMGEFKIEWKDHKRDATYDIYINGDHLETVFGLEDAKTKVAVHILETATGLVETQPIFLLPDNLLSHRTAWMEALRKLITLTPQDDNRSYYRHEFVAMKEMYDDLDKRMFESTGDAPPLPAVSEDGVMVSTDVLSRLKFKTYERRVAGLKDASTDLSRETQYSDQQGDKPDPELVLKATVPYDTLHRFYDFTLESSGSPGASLLHTAVFSTLFGFLFELPGFCTYASSNLEKSGELIVWLSRQMPNDAHRIKVVLIPSSKL